MGEVRLRRIAALTAPVLAAATRLTAESCAPLPPPVGPVVTVANVSALQAAVAGATPGQTLLVAPGHYDLDGAYLRIAAPGVTLRGQGGDREAVVLDGNYPTIYTGAVRKMKDFISSGELGNLFYFDSVRVNLGLFQSDVNVVWDLASHDVSIMDHIIPDQPKSVVAMGGSHTDNGIEDIAYVTVKFDG